MSKKYQQPNIQTEEISFDDVLQFTPTIQKHDGTDVETGGGDAE